MRTKLLRGHMCCCPAIVWLLPFVVSLPFAQAHGGDSDAGQFALQHEQDIVPCGLDVTQEDPTASGFLLSLASRRNTATLNHPMTPLLMQHATRNGMWLPSPTGSDLTTQQSTFARSPRERQLEARTAQEVDDENDGDRGASTKGDYNEKNSNEASKAGATGSEKRRSDDAYIQRVRDAFSKEDGKPCSSANVRFARTLEDAIDDDPRRHSETNVRFERLSGPDERGLSMWRVHDEIKSEPFEIQVPEASAIGRMPSQTGRHTNQRLKRHLARMRKARHLARKAANRNKREFDQFQDWRKRTADDGMESTDEVAAEDTILNHLHLIPSGGQLQPATTVDDGLATVKAMTRNKNLFSTGGGHTGSSPLWGSFARAFWATADIVPPSCIDSYWYERGDPAHDLPTRLAMWIVFETPESERKRDMPKLVRFPWFLNVETQRKRENMNRGEWYKIGEARTLQQDGQQGASARIYFHPMDVINDVRHLWKDVGIVHKFAQLSPAGTPGLLRYCLTGISYERVKTGGDQAVDMRSYNFWLLPPTDKAQKRRDSMRAIANHEGNTWKENHSQRHKRKLMESGLHDAGRSSPELSTRPTLPPNIRSGVSWDDVRGMRKRSTDWIEGPVESDVSSELATLPFIHPNSIYPSTQAAANELIHHCDRVSMYTLQFQRVVLSYREYLLTATCRPPNGTTLVVGTLFYVPNHENQMQGLQKRAQVRPADYQEAQKSRSAALLDHMRGDPTLLRRGVLFDPYSRPLLPHRYSTDDEVWRDVVGYWPQLHDFEIIEANRIPQRDAEDSLAFAYLLGARDSTGKIVTKRFEFYRKKRTLYQSLGVYDTLSEARQAFLDSHPNITYLTFTRLRVVPGDLAQGLRRYRYNVEFSTTASAHPSASAQRFVYDFHIREYAATPPAMAPIAESSSAWDAPDEEHALGNSSEQAANISSSAASSSSDSVHTHDYEAFT